MATAEFRSVIVSCGAYDGRTTLFISPEKAHFIVAKARQFDARDGLTDPDSGFNATDDGMRSVLEDRTHDPVRSELVNFIHDLNDDEQIGLVALTWLGRGDGDIENWDELRAEATRAHNKRTAAYLLGKPMLADHLEEALSKFGHSSEEVEASLTVETHARDIYRTALEHAFAIHAGDIRQPQIETRAELTHIKGSRDGLS